MVKSRFVSTLTIREIHKVPYTGMVPNHGEAFVAAEVGCSRNGGHRLLTSIDQVRVNLGRYGSVGKR